MCISKQSEDTEKGENCLIFHPKSVLLSWTVVGSIATLRIVCWTLSKFCCYSALPLRFLNLVAFSPQQSDLSQWSMKQELVYVVNKYGFGILIELWNIFKSNKSSRNWSSPVSLSQRVEGEGESLGHLLP